MRISQKLDYTVRGLVALAGLAPGTTVVVGDLADRLGLPRRFLEQQFTVISKRGLVACHRGAGGGCMLARAPETITVGDVMSAIEGEVVDVPHVAGSATSEMWSEMASGIERIAGEITLADLARRQSAIDADRTPMYYI